MCHLLQGKTALVTGASSGIGSAIARTFIEHGAHVMGIGLDDSPASENLARLGTFKFVRGDLRAQSAVDSLVDMAMMAYGRIDILVNNAAYLPMPAPLDCVTPDVWEHVLEINVLSVAKLTTRLLPLMRSAEYGRIINIGSVLSIYATPNGGPYAVSKHALLGLTRTQALEYAPIGITSNCILPGGVDTEMFRRGDSGGQFRRHVEERCPLQRMAEPREIATTALFLASSLSSYVNGHALIVDGGLTLGV